MAVLLLVQLNVSPPPVLALKGIALMDWPAQTATLATVLTTGCGLMVMVNVLTAPVQPFRVAVTLIVPTISEPVKFAGAVKEAMLPVPDAARPIEVLLLVQLNVSPPPVLAEKLMAAILCAGQDTTLATAATTGSGRTVMVNVMGTLVQPFFVAVTLIVPTTLAPVKLPAAANDEIVPEPDAPKPMAVLLLVQLKVSLPPVFARKLRGPTVAPGHTTMSVCVPTTGCGLTVIWKFIELLAQPLRVAVTLMVLTNATPVLFDGAVQETTLPVPLAANPIAVFELVQVNVSPPPALAVKFNGPIVCPGQATMLAMVVTIG